MFGSKDISKKILIVLGSGASKSLMAKEKKYLTGFGGYKELPTGDELVNNIIDYERKSIAWLIAYSCYSLIKTSVCSINKNASGYIDGMSPDADFLGLARYTESIYPKEYYNILSESEIKLLKDDLQKKYSKYFAHSLNSKIDNSSIEITIDLGDSGSSNYDVKKISKLFQASDFIIKRFDGISKYFDVIPEYLDDITKYLKITYMLSVALFFKLLIIITSNSTYDELEKILNKKNSLDLVLSKIYESIVEIMHNAHNITDANIISSRLYNNEIAPISLYTTKNDAFDKAIQDIKGIIISIANIFNISSDYYQFTENVSHLKGCYLSAALVSHYKPYSIDYFMMNLVKLAPYEFFEIEHNACKQYRIESIQKYTKFIIADCLMPAATYAHHARDPDNYIKRMLWRILENALFYKKELSEYLKENVNIITFNYETSFETVLCEMLFKQDAEELQIKTTEVYGKIYLEYTDGEKKNNLNMCNNNAIWQSLFFMEKDIKDKDIFAISTIGKHTENYSIKYILCENVFEQLNERIKWMGEQQNTDEIKNDRDERQDNFVNADEVYFLGFGFDTNNLYQLGIIDTNNKLVRKLKNKKKHTKILVSGGNAKITNTLKDIFNINNTSLVNDVHHIKNEKYDIYISPKLLPEALITDL